MYNTVFLTLLVFSPILFQTPSTPNPVILTGDPVGDILKLIGGIIAAYLGKIFLNRINEFRSDLASYREASKKNTESVSTLDTSVSSLDTRVQQLETDLSRAIRERNEAQARVITVQAAADAAKEYAEAQIKSLEDKNRVLNSDLITERVINAELAGNIRDLRTEQLKQKQQIEQLQAAGLIADAIAQQVAKMNSQT